MRLFVDCDDTLVLWPDEPHLNQDKKLWQGDEYELNHPLIEEIKIFFRDRPREDALIIWSGGGADYAATWARRCFPHGEYLSLSKDIVLPNEDDICIDDMAIRVPCLLMTPAMAVGRLNNAQV